MTTMPTVTAIGTRREGMRNGSSERPAVPRSPEMATQRRTDGRWVCVAPFRPARAAVERITVRTVMERTHWELIGSRRHSASLSTPTRIHKRTSSTTPAHNLMDCAVWPPSNSMLPLKTLPIGAGCCSFEHRIGMRPLCISNA